MTTARSWIRRATLTAVAITFVAVAVGAAAGWRLSKSSGRTGAADELWTQGIRTLGNDLSDLEDAARRADTVRARSAFRAARRDFKRIEGLLYFHSPILTAQINSPRLDDDDAPTPLPLATPIGFQTIESALFDGDFSLDSARLETKRMRWFVGQFQLLAQNTRISDATLVDAARIELARVTTLGLAGFDAGSSGDQLREAAEALEGIRLQLALLHASDTGKRSVDETLRRATAALGADGGGDVENFNRLRFITGFAEPVAQAIAALRRELGTTSAGVRSVWRSTAASPFQYGAFDPAGYAPSHARHPTPALIALGERLFFEPRLSGPGTHSCASCHKPAKAFTDGLARANPLPGAHPKALRNTPTLWNAAFQPTLFADDRARSFEAQAGVVLTSHAEMASSPEMAATRLMADRSYRAAFTRAMPDRGDSAITALEIRQALAAYERTLTALNSRFDRAVRGDTLALTARERAGFTVFMGKGRCGTCHFVPLFNGVQPPDFKSAEPEIIGVTADTNFRRPRLDPDVGRGAVELNEVNLFAFKVPTLRNIALTAPYMHNGAFATLESVIDFYDAGGGAGLGVPLPNPTLSPDSLHLTPVERKALAAFLGALTDTTLVRDP